MKITHFEIFGLHGSFHISFPIKDNKVILTGVNGMGKSTVLNLLYYLISAQWEKLTNFEFEKMRLTVNGEVHEFTRSEIEEDVIQTRRATDYLPPSMRRRISEIKELDSTIFFKVVNQSALTHAEKSQISDYLMLPQSRVDMVLKDIGRYWKHTTEDKAFAKKIAAFTKHIDKKVMYLPTYRRIEKDLKLIIPDIEEKIRGEISSRRETERYIELVEFGMDDIVFMIDSFISRMNFNALSEHSLLSQSYLQEIIRGQIASVEIPTLKTGDLQSISELGEAMGLAAKDIQHLEKTISKLSGNKKNANILSVEEKYVIRYVVKLLEVSKKLENLEVPFKDFIGLCNAYLEGKQCEYDRKSRKFYIKPAAGAAISLKNLSSGEKQIISLFCHLNLGNKDDYLVIIDEPELSLSVEWQKKLLPDIVNTEHCSFLAAVTHSPFVFTNELEKYTIDLEDYKKSTVLL